MPANHTYIHRDKHRHPYRQGHTQRQTGADRLAGNGTLQTYIHTHTQTVAEPYIQRHTDRQTYVQIHRETDGQTQR